MQLISMAQGAGGELRSGRNFGGYYGQVSRTFHCDGDRRYALHIIMTIYDHAECIVMLS